MLRLKAPFPYFGSKRKVAGRVWAALGDVRHYIEPFFGSGAVLLSRPDYNPLSHIETVCDADGHLCNVWRALQSSPDEVARYCDWPVNHVDLMARRRILSAKTDYLLERLLSDADWHDAKLAGYWIWASSCWIGSGLICPGKIPNISNAGKGVHAGKMPHIGHAGKGVREPYNDNLIPWFRRLSERLRFVRVVCGDWSRVCGGSWQDKIGLCGVFFDPPYSKDAGRDRELYASEDFSVAHAVREWCLERGKMETYRIVLAGYDNEHTELEEHGWTRESWSAMGGYGNTARFGKKTKGQANRHRETLWFSPHCITKACAALAAERGEK